MKYFFIMLFSLSVFADNNLKVMIIDSGVDGSNLSLIKHIPKQFRNDFDLFDTMGHGTFVFGTIAEAACPQVELIPCKVFTDGVSANRLYNCFKYALELKVDIINFSGGGTTYYQKEADYMKKFNDQDILFVAATGNNNSKLEDKPFYPASYDYPNIVSVGALDPDRNAACFSNHGNTTVWEPGVNIISDSPGNKKNTLSGTSMATAKHTARLVRFFCKKINK